MRRPLVVANWKMHGDLASNAKLLAALRDAIPQQVDVALCAPFPYLPQCAQVLEGSRLAWGAQDVSSHESGAFTGEISGAMLAEFGARFAIVGHSERRHFHAETSTVVAAKAAAALKAGLTPIVCVGETAREREAGLAQDVVRKQLQATLDLGSSAVSATVIAYEPIWAVGTGKNASPVEAQSMHACIRQALHQLDPALARMVRVLYGGSVKPGNAIELFAMPDVDGGLIGGASLVAQDFLAILAAAALSKSDTEIEE